MPIATLDEVTTLVDGLDHPEGVAWGPDGRVYAGGEAGQIYRVGLDGGVTQVASTGGFVLGLCLDGAGAVYACDHVRHAVMRVGPDGAVSTYAFGAPDRPMRTPNVPAFAADGSLWVSDSGSWKGEDGCLFRVRPGGATEVVGEGFESFPNGLALAPDGRHLYVALSTRAAVVRAPLLRGGALGPPETVVELPRTVPDGLAFDRDGNLYVACYAPHAILRVDPAGRVETLVEDWQGTAVATPTNVAFAGPGLRTLVIASLSRWHLATLEVAVPGQPLHYPDLPPTDPPPAPEGAQRRPER